MKILVYSTLYPNNAQQRNGIFVEQRLRHFLELHPSEVKVVAPVPWFPVAAGKYGVFASVERTETRHGIDILHPRYPVIPKIGMRAAPLLLAAATLPTLRRMIRDGFDFDFIDAHYYYPDGVAAAIIARILNKPLLITARGTDINLIPQYRLPRKMILWAAEQAYASITVCDALKQEMRALGADGEKIHVMRNGVNLELFKPLDRLAIRKRLGLEHTTLLSAGHLTERKGHHLVIEAMQALPECELLLAGDGEEFPRLEKLVQDLGLNDRVRFLGALTHDELAKIYNAADIMVLASSREGWANVLLESMACGTPVVATAIWGTPEVVATPEAGRLIPERTASAIADGAKALLEDYPERSATRHYAEQFSWTETNQAQLRLFREVLALLKPG